MNLQRTTALPTQTELSTSHGLTQLIQRLSQHVFEGLDACADGGLRDVQRPGGFSEMRRFRDREEGSCEVDVHLPDTHNVVAHTGDGRRTHRSVHFDCFERLCGS